MRVRVRVSFGALGSKKKPLDFCQDVYPFVGRGGEGADEEASVACRQMTRLSWVEQPGGVRGRGYRDYYWDLFLSLGQKVKFVCWGKVCEVV